MIQIRNVTAGTAAPMGMAFGTKYASTPGHPAYVKLGPGEHVIFHDQALRDWHPVIKQHLVEYMVQGIAKVYSINSAHIYQDKGNVCERNFQYILDADQQYALEATLTVATAMHVVMNRHFTNLIVHNVATAEIAAVIPTDLAELLLWITGAQVAYEAHRLDVGAHPNLDTVNIVTLGPPGNLPEAVDALRELHRVYHSHKGWLVPTASELDAASVLTF